MFLIVLCFCVVFSPIILIKSVYRVKILIVYICGSFLIFSGPGWLNELGNWIA
jgi:hypothetical protein